MSVPVVSSSQSTAPKRERVDYLSLLADEQDLLDESYAEVTSALDSLTELYAADPADPGTREVYRRVLRELRQRAPQLAQKGAMLFEKEKALHVAFKTYEKELHELHATSYAQMNKTAELVFDENVRASEIQVLGNGLGTLKEIEIDGDEQLDLSLSKEQLVKIINIERTKRAQMRLKIDYSLDPKIRSSKAGYEKLAAKYKELNEFLYDRVDEMSKKVQAVKKMEGWESC